MIDLYGKQVAIRKEEDEKQLATIEDKVILKGLNPKQRKFCLMFPASGSPMKAAEDAGYHANEEDYTTKRAKLRSVVAALMRNPQIKRNIDIINDQLLVSGVATARRIQMFWSEVMEDESVKLNFRLEASKLLAKCFPEFAEKVVVEQRGKIEHEHRPVFSNISPGAIGRKLGMAEDQNIIDIQPDNDETDDILI